MTTRRLLLLVMVSGAATYGSTYLAELGFLARLGVAPDEVSISCASLLPRAVAGLLVPLVALGTVLLPVAGVVHRRLRAANVRAARRGRATVGEQDVLAFDVAGALVLPMVWAVGALVCSRALAHLPGPVGVAGVVGAWAAVLILPVLPAALVLAGLTRLALWLAERARAGRAAVSHAPPALPTAGVTVGVLVLLAAMTVLPALAGSYVYGSRAAGRLARTGDLRPLRVDYTLPGGWLAGLALPQVRCVRAEWVGGPSPASLPGGPALALGTSGDVLVLYDVARQRSVRLYVGSSLTTGVPDRDCRR